MLGLSQTTRMKPNSPAISDQIEHMSINIELNKKYNHLEWLFIDSYSLLSEKVDFIRNEPKKNDVQLTFEVLRTLDENVNNLYLETGHKLNELQKFTNQNNYFSVFSSLDCFINSYQNGLEKFLKSNSDSSEDQFIEKQIYYLKLIVNDFDLLEKDLKYSFLNKIKYLENRFDCNDSIEVENNIQTIQAVYLLNKLGVINLLREQGKSNVKISKIIGKIIGRSPQKVRELLGKIDLPTKLGSSQIASIEEIESFFNSL